MARRVLGWGGLVVGVAALGVFFALAGLERADKLASVLGAFVGLAGLGVAVYGLTGSRRSEGTEGVHNSISGVVYGTAVQARDVHGGVGEKAVPPGDSVERVRDEES